MTPKNRRGHTLVEMIIAVTIMAAIIAGIVLLLGKNISLVKRSSVRQQIMLESRICMETILRALSNGKAGTLRISTPAISPAIPNSIIQFDAQTPSGALIHHIIWLTGGTDAGTVLWREGAQANRVLAKNVTALMFTGDSRDPALVGVTLRIDAPWDASGDPSHVSTLILPNQVAQMVEMP